MTYHYTDSGLDNVYLTNGYNVVKTPYGDAVSIDGLRSLHKAIGEGIVEQQGAMNGAEFRFLRKELDLTQSALAGIMGEQVQSIARWEKNRTKPLRGSADKLMRVLYDEYINGDGSTRRVIDKIVVLDNKIAKADINLSATANGWWKEPIAA